MSYKYDKSDDAIVIKGWEEGIAVSPSKGLGNLQNVNIATETGEVMCSFPRINQIPSLTNFTLSFFSSNSLQYSFVNPFTFTKGMAITIGSGITTLAPGTYWIVSVSGSGFSGVIQIASTYNGSAISTFSSGSANVSTVSMGIPVQDQVEDYKDSSGNTQFRYYILDNGGLLWVNDTSLNASGYGWFLSNTPPYIANIAASGPVSGLGLINGWLFAFVGINIFVKPTVNFSDSWQSFPYGTSITQYNSHFSYTGHQGVLYYCDGTFIGSITPNNQTVSGLVNIQSYASYTSTGTSTSATGTITALIDGSLPIFVTAANSIDRIPAAFFTGIGGSLPSALPTAGKLYWIQMNPNALTFQVYAAQTGGSPLDTTSGATGTQYFNNFYPFGAVCGGQASTAYIFTPQRLNLPFFETAQSLIELGDSIIVGGKTNTLYQWNQVDDTPQSLIQLPENDVHFMIGVNNMGYIFAGHKGNIYITNGSTASAVISLPDYCAGIAGTPSSYIEPYFTWGGADYIRGRVYFSIQDQIATKTGNCGGVWSFIPTQNLFFGQDVGLALRLENTNSYNTLNGMANLIIGNQVQSAIGPQYFTAWTSSTTSPTYGIDASGTFPTMTATIETDLISTGNMLYKKTFEQIIFKLSSPLLSGETIALNYRLNSTDAWQSCGIQQIEANALSGYYPANFQLSQWLQLQIVMTPNSTSTFSGNRLTEIRIK